jgi:mono/diheme cytochrome c family protein
MKHRITLTLVMSALLASAVACGAEQKPKVASSAPPAAPPAAPAAAPAAAAPGPAASTTADASTVAELSKPSGGPHGGLYTVIEGNKVDAKTLQGWKTWRALACERCHGAEQEGLVGPPLVTSLHNLTKEQFHTTIMNGRPEKGMPPFSASKMVVDNWEGLYAYLKGRADAQIKPGHLYALDSKQTSSGSKQTSNDSKQK